MTPHPVLISYSHDSEAHRARVLALADALRACGVDAWIDRYDAWPADGWEAWMASRVQHAEVVVCVVTPEYARRFDGTLATGVGYEADLLRKWRRREGTLQLTVQFDAADVVIPLELQSWSIVVPPGELASPRQGVLPPALARLLRAILRLSEEAPAPLGRLLGWAAVRSPGHVTPAHPGFDVEAGHAPALLAYLDWVAELADQAELGAHGQRTSLERLYVRPRERALAGGVDVDLEDLVRRDTRGRWAVLGDPGSGKTTLLRHLAVDLARGTATALEDGKVLGPGSVPVLLPLPAWARRRGRPEDLAVELFVDDPPVGLQRGDPSPDAVRAALRYAADQGRLLYLLDGLDEVPPGDRGELDGLLQRLADARHPCAAAYTSRRFGYTRPSDRFVDYELLPFDADQQRALLVKRLEPEQVEGMLTEVATERSLAALAANPLMLGLLADVARETWAADPGARLPTRRVDVYDWIVARLLRARRERGQGDDGELRVALGDLAWHLLEAGGGTWSWRRAELAAVLRKRPAGRLVGRADPVDWLAFRCGLVSERARRGPRRTGATATATVEFTHRSLLEYLAAEHLRTLSNDAAIEVARRVGGSERSLVAWSETFAMWAGLAEDPIAALRVLERSNPILATRALPEVDELDVEAMLAFLGLTGEELGLVRTVMDRVSDRTACGRLLAKLAHHRNDRDMAALCAAGCFAVGDEAGLEAIRSRWPGVAPYRWCAIPGGTFAMGSEGLHAGERPGHDVTLSPFRMLNVPVTRALYAVISGQDPSAFREDLLTPVENVAWFDAVAFTNELSARLGRAPTYDVKRKDVTWTRSADGVRLPTEAEWEYACRSPMTRSPRCCADTAVSRVEVARFVGDRVTRTLPVGGKGPNAWGLHDTHGNVWEWCWDWLGDYPPGPQATTSLPYGPYRVLRGGVFWGTADSCRMSCRMRFPPHVGNSAFGFRVVLPAIVATPSPRVVPTAPAIPIAVHSSDPESDVPAPPPTALAALLQSLFSVDELRRFVWSVPGAEGVAGDLTEGPVKPATFSLEVATALARNGSTGPGLFAALRAVRPRREADIAEVERAALPRPVVPVHHPAPTRTRRWDLFLAHASPDKDRALDLYDALVGHCRVFLDAKCLLPGDPWDLRIDEAQQDSHVTVVLVSDRVPQAWYARDEIARAIALTRDPDGGHRVVPVFLGGRPGPRSPVPYGLRTLHGIEAPGDMAPVAEALLAMLEALGLSRRD